MRTTLNSMTFSFERTMQQLQAKRFNQQVQLQTGSQLTSVSNTPEKFAAAGQISNLIARSEKHQVSIDRGLDELRASEEALSFVAESLIEIRMTAQETTNATNFDKIPTLAVNIKNKLFDLIRSANQDFDGKYLFSGTKTTAESIEIPGTLPPGVVAGDIDTNPFQVVNATPSLANQSGLTVLFKGNFQSRLINTSVTSTEQVNVTADTAFGGPNGTSVFDTVVKLYNAMAFNEDGTPKEENQNYTANELEIVIESIKEISKKYDEINATISNVGMQIIRLQTMSDQSDIELTRLREFKSREVDTDYAKTVTELQKTELTLQYSLKVGSNLFQQSLLDFLR